MWILADLEPRLAEFRRDERASITIEFIIWVPLLAFWLVVGVAFFDAFKSRSDSAKAAETLADIISRQVEIDNAFIAELYALQQVLLPRTPTGARLRVTSIRFLENDELDEGDDEHRVEWSVPIGGDAPMENVQIPLSILPEMADRDTIVLTELYVPFQPFTSWGGIGFHTWTNVLVARPRFVSAIAKVD